MRRSEVEATAAVPKADFIRAMRMVASSVAVVTTDGSAGRHGATVSAFSSVSADPPTVLVCLRGESRISQAVAANRRLCVNVLSPDREDIANRFAGKDDDRLADRFSGIEVYGCPGTPPEIDGATIFQADVDQIVTSGSHHIFICKVMTVREGLKKPLTYMDGSYHHVIPQNASSTSLLARSA